MPPLTPSERRALRARAHPLKPVVFVGQQGLTPAVLHEIDVALTAHELIKVRVFDDDREARDALLARISADLDCAPVQHLGKILTLWRPARELPEPKPMPRRKAAPGAPVPSSAAHRREPRKRGPSASRAPFEPGTRTPGAGAEPARRRRHRP